MLRFLLLSLLVLTLDQLSKAWVVDHLREQQVVEVWPVFNLTLAYNEGAAFSFLAGAGGWQQSLFIGLASVISLGILLWLWRLPPQRRLEAWALSLILGGALGNLVDRVSAGRVVDFLQWHWQAHYFPAFNLADSAITLGVILLLLDTLGGERRHPRV
jgi:signal peptidase II